MNLHLGYEVGSGNAVEIPLKHMAITGQTQEAGKTTALEALINRAKLTAVTFITKRGEASFTEARRIDPYFREHADWQYVAAILEASRGEKLKFERAWIIRASKGARTLADVQRNVQKALDNPKIRGMSADVYLTLDAYLDEVVPQIAKVHWAPTVDLRPGVNVVDLTGITENMQHLVIRSTITWVLEHAEDTIVVVPEAWKFIPQGRGTPVKLAAEAFIRQAAALRNFLWLDSQDIGGIEKQILRSVPLWIIGVQREANEIKRTLANIPAGLRKPKPEAIATLELGEFFACWGKNSVHTYVQPRWLSDDLAQGVAMGVVKRTDLKAFERKYGTQHVEQLRYDKPEPEPVKEPEPMSYDQKLADAEKLNSWLTKEMKWATEKLGREVDDNWEVNVFKATVELAAARLAEKDSAPERPPSSATAPSGGKVQTGPIDISAIERVVSITFSQETRNFMTTGPRGMLMFVLVNDLKNKPSTEGDMSTAMQARGWNYGHSTLSPEIGKLVKSGDFMKEGERPVRYSVPGKLLLQIDGRKVSL